MRPISRDALRTGRYLDDLLDADGRHSDAPADLDTDPQVRFAAAALRTGLVRVHPSFRFEEALAVRLNSAALRLRAGLPADAPVAEPGSDATVAFPAPGAPHVSAGVRAAADAPSAAEPAPPVGVRATVLRRIPELAARQSKPLVIGGVGVASAALSIGAFYVAWRHTHAASGRMGRAARVNGRSAQSGRRRPGIAEEIIGAVS